MRSARPSLVCRLIEPRHRLAVGSRKHSAEALHSIQEHFRFRSESVFLTPFHSMIVASPPFANKLVCGKRCYHDGSFLNFPVKRDGLREGKGREEGRKEGRKEETNYTRRRLFCSHDFLKV